MRSRRGTIYIMVLGVSMLVLTIGVGAALAAREGVARQDQNRILLGADAAARSTLELALSIMNNAPSAVAGWTRQEFLVPTQLGDYAVAFAVLDPDGRDRGASLNRLKVVALAQGDGVRQYRSMIVEPTLNPGAGEAAYRVIPGSYRIEVEQP
jgi:hypothetical protein